MIPYILFILLAIPILLVVRKLYVEIKLKNNYFLSLTIVLFIVYFILLMNQLFVYISYYNDFSGYAIFATVLVAIFVLSLQFFFYNEIVKKRIENIKKEEMIHAAEQFNLEVEKQNNEIKKFKHDYRNILLSLDYFIEQKEWGKLREYYEITIKESQKKSSKDKFYTVFNQQSCKL
ncbi:Putative membrane protein (fragment) [Carnobacterium maltaromaticum]